MKIDNLCIHFGKQEKNEDKTGLAISVKGTAYQEEQYFKVCAYGAEQRTGQNSNNFLRQKSKTKQKSGQECWKKAR